MTVIVRRIAISGLLVAIGVTNLFFANGVGVECQASADNANNQVDFSDLEGAHEALRKKFEVDHEQGNSNKQESENLSDMGPSQEPLVCETAASYLDFAVIDSRELKESYLIIIARLGTGENSRSLNQHRLGVIEEYILRRGSDLKYVLAKGSKVNGLGRIELYVGGRLTRVMPPKEKCERVLSSWTRRILNQYQL